MYEELEVPSGFEPLNIGFADRPLRPLGHGTSRAETQMVPGKHRYLGVLVAVDQAFWSYRTLGGAEQIRTAE